MRILPYKRKSWQEKLEDKKGFPKTLELASNFPCWRALEKMGAQIGDSVVLTQPSEVISIMNAVPRGKVITLAKICEKLARKHKAQFCCTLTTGIFVTIAANAAEETESDIPYWRTIKNTGELNPKYPGGAERQKVLLEQEGHIITQRGKKHIRYFVEDFERSLVD